MIDLKGLEEELKEDLHKVESLTQLQGIKAKYIGKSGFITQAIANIKNVPPEERREYGQRVNKLKEYAEELIRKKEEELKKLELEKRLSQEWLDLSVVLEPSFGTYHQLTKTLKRIKDIFVSMGFSVMEGLEEELKEDLHKVESLTQLQGIKAKYIGKSGFITQAIANIKNVPPEERREYGQRVNKLKEYAEELIRKKEEELKKLELEKRLSQEWLDLSVVLEPSFGTYHPLTKTLKRIKDIFVSMGFSVMEGPEVELEEYNFDKLNIPKDHPARDMQDTFYVNKEGYLLRTHTSPVQIRTMLSQKPPIYMIAPGKVYRRDDDPTHSPMFHQVEGLAVDKYINFGHMKYTIETFLKEFFEVDVPVRFRASYFPFTEPSAEVDIGCVICGGEGCRVCKESGWLEVMGCGMVHPAVLENCHIDPEVYQGFAFGMGVERLAMLYFGIDNIKLFFENDLRFLKQF